MPFQSRLWDASGLVTREVAGTTEMKLDHMLKLNVKL